MIYKGGLNRPHSCWYQCFEGREGLKSARVLRSFSSFSRKAKSNQRIFIIGDVSELGGSWERVVTLESSAPLQQPPSTVLPLMRKANTSEFFSSFRKRLSSFYAMIRAILTDDGRIEGGRSG